MSKIRIFVSYDRHHDEDLFALLAQGLESAGFEVAGSSRARTRTQLRDEKVREQIRRASEVIVICGEYTDEAPCVDAELRIAQEERQPYFLLWGRREKLCIKPPSARRDDGMYRWSGDTLRTHVVTTLRNSIPWASPGNRPRGGCAPHVTRARGSAVSDLGVAPLEGSRA